MCANVCIAYNEPLPGIFEAAGEGSAVSSVLDAVEAVMQAVTAREGTVHAEAVRSISPAFDQRLQELNPRLVFNLFEGFDGEPESEGELALMLEGRDTPFTGAPACSLFDCVDKGKTKQKLRTLGLPTADWHVFPPRSPARVEYIPAAVSLYCQTPGHRCQSRHNGSEPCPYLPGNVRAGGTDP